MFRMSRHFDRVHKNSALVKKKLELSAGLGHYSVGLGHYSTASENPVCDMDRSSIRHVLKLLDLGFKKVNFSVRLA